MEKAAPAAAAIPVAAPQAVVAAPQAMAYPQAWAPGWNPMGYQYGPWQPGFSLRGRGRGGRGRGGKRNSEGNPKCSVCGLFGHKGVQCKDRKQ